MVRSCLSSCVLCSWINASFAEMTDFLQLFWIFTEGEVCFLKFVDPLILDFKLSLHHYTHYMGTSSICNARCTCIISRGREGGIPEQRLSMHLEKWDKPRSVRCQIELVLEKHKS